MISAWTIKKPRSTGLGTRRNRQAGLFGQFGQENISDGNNYYHGVRDFSFQLNDKKQSQMVQDQEKAFEETQCMLRYMSIPKRLLTQNCSV